MENWWIKLIIFHALFICIAIVAVVIKKTKKKNEQFVRETSKRLWDIQHINAMFPFNTDLKAKYLFSTRVNSKRNFDRFQFDQYFHSQIDEHETMFFAIIDKLEVNCQLNEQYVECLRSIAPYADENETKNYPISQKRYQRIEERLCEAEILKPITETSFICEVRYTSPQGRNNYCEQSVYMADEFAEHYQMTLEERERRKQNEEFKQSKEYQRRKMTDALRYQILQRDGFRCQLCGKSAQTDPTVELEVDHIYPVSKGGKTEPTNLRTLCKTCNRGKRDKYDENGLN